MPRTGHFKVDDLAKANPAAYNYICGKVKENASLDETARGVKENFGLIISKNAIYNWRTQKYSKELQAQQIAVELTNLLNEAIRDRDPEEAREKIIRGMLENLALQVLNNNKLDPENIINAVAIFRRLDNEKQKIQADARKHDVEIARLHLAEKAADKQIEYYKLKMAEIQKTAKDSGKVTDKQLDGILHGYFGIGKDGQDKKKH